MTNDLVRIKVLDGLFYEEAYISAQLNSLRVRYQGSYSKRSLNGNQELDYSSVDKLMQKDSKKHKQVSVK